MTINPKYEKTIFGQLCRGVSIVLVGAGSMCSIILKENTFLDDYFDIKEVADSQKVGKICNGKPIVSFNDIVSVKCDYIVISILTPMIAKEVRNELISIGILKTKIIQCTVVEEMALRKEQEYRKFLNRNSFGISRKMWIFMVPEHGNAGDYAIAFSEIDFIHTFFEEYETVTVTTLEWRYASDYIKSKISDDDVIFLNGGGYLGDLWEEDSDDFRGIVNAFPENVIFFFPNTMSYKDSLEGSVTFRQDMECFRSKKNLYVMLRDKTSYEQYVKYDERAALFPDMVLFQGAFSREYIESMKSERCDKVLLCLRKDREKVTDIDDQIKKSLHENGFDFDEIEINTQRHIDFDQGDEYIREICDKMKQYRCVITDRLHGTVFAMKTEVPCITIDNLTHKITGMLKWQDNEKYVLLHTNDEFDAKEEIEVAVERKNKAGKYFFSECEYISMANYIRSRLDGSQDE